jgi:N-acetylglucosaminyldiphosphoundecaprenol N-acetyl-beta-D-mannosaminyltransferase
MRSCALAEFTPHPPIAILGVPFDGVTTGQAVAMIERMITSQQPHYIVTANVDFLVQAREDVELRRILLDAHLVLCDGTPLVWASRLLGNRLPERVAGSDLVPHLIRVAAEKQFRLFFLGAAPESCEQAVSNLKQKFPQLVIAGHYSPPFQQLLEMNHDEIVRQIKQAHPDLLFVSFGCPKQEKWIAMHYRSLGVPVTIGVGATIDFLAGRVRRAPVWMQRSGTEWVFRLAQEPRRLFRRYAKDLGVFGWNIATQWWQLKPLSNEGDVVELLPHRTEDTAIKMPPRLDCSTVQNTAIFQKLLGEKRNCLIDMSSVEFIDSTGVGFLIQLHKNVRSAGHRLVLVAPTKATRRALKLMRLEEYFFIAENFSTAQQLIESDPIAKPVCVNGKISWRGELTAANAEDVWQETQSHFRTGEKSLLIDLERLRFVDSTGLGLMVRAKKFGREKGMNVVFTGIQPAVRNVIQVARLESFLLSS